MALPRAATPGRPVQPLRNPDMRFGMLTPDTRSRPTATCGKAETGRYRSRLSLLVLVCPGLAAREREIVGVGNGAPFRLMIGRDLVGDAVPLAIGDRLLLAVELKTQLLAHVAGTGPAHQRLHGARLFRLVVQHPFARLGRTGLHRRTGRLVDACHHRRFPSPGLLVQSRCSVVPQCRTVLVGAAGFEPATWSTQNSRATRLRYAPPVGTVGRRRDACATRYTLRRNPASAGMRRNASGFAVKVLQPNK